MKKKLLPIILLCSMLAASLLLAAQATGDDIVAKGDCGAEGSSVRWSLDNKGNLTITGTGAIADYKPNEFWGLTWRNSPALVTSLIINDGVTEIGNYAFYNLDRLSKVTLPDSLTRVKEGAFGRCSSLTKITFPDGVSSIEDYVFRECSNLVSFTISDSVTSIGQNAFTGCDHLTKIVIPKSVESIGKNAFWHCDRLKSVTILGDIPIMTAGIVQDCPALTEITIPDSVVVIEEKAFSGSEALKDVYFTGTESMWKEISIDGKNEPLENATLHFDTSVEATYRIDALSVSDTDGKTLTAIPEGSFLATVSITNRASGATPLVLLASYDANGQYQGLMYVTVREPVGGTVDVTLPVDNSGGKIAQLKVFAVKSFADMTPIGNVVSFPA